jgi:hypothetical protein
MPQHFVEVVELDQRSKLYDIRKVYVGEIEGNAGPMTRERIMALIASSGRFQVVDVRGEVDALIVGRSEARDTGTEIKEHSAGWGGAIGGAAGNANKLAGGINAAVTAIAGSASAGNSTVKSEILTTDAFVLRVMSSGGELLWAWEDTKPCCQLKGEVRHR